MVKQEKTFLPVLSARGQWSWRYGHWRWTGLAEAARGVEHFGENRFLPLVHLERQSLELEKQRAAKQAPHATAIQRIWRGYKVRFVETKQASCAMVIQRIWRGFRIRLLAFVPPEPENPCVICFEEIEAKNEATLDCCTHRFCFVCITTWAQSEKTCPQCRGKFSAVTLSEQTVENTREYERQRRTYRRYSSYSSHFLNMFH